MNPVTTNTTDPLAALTLSKLQRRCLLTFTMLDCVVLTILGVCGLTLLGYALTDIPDDSITHAYHLALRTALFCIIFTMLYGLVISLYTRQLRHASGLIKTGWRLTALSVVSPLLPVVCWLCGELIAMLVFHGRSEISGDSIWAAAVMSSGFAMFFGTFLVYGFAIRAALSSWKLLRTAGKATPSP